MEYSTRLDTEQQRRHIYPGNMTFYKYHGRQRQQDANLVFERDVVFSTYATLASEPSRGIGILNSVEWFRIVLDEGEPTPSSQAS